MSDIGAIEPGSWHDWHLAWKIGATSFENVTVWSAAAADVATPGAASSAADGEGPCPQVKLHSSHHRNPF